MKTNYETNNNNKKNNKTNKQNSVSKAFSSRNQSHKSQTEMWTFYFYKIKIIKGMEGKPDIIAGKIIK